MEEFMTLEEVAKRLRVNKKTVYRLLANGSMPATRVGHQWRFDRSIIDGWLARRSTGRPVTILVIDDEPSIRELFVEAFAERKCEVSTAEGGQEGLRLIKTREFDMVFLDLKLSGMDGVEVFREIRQVKPNLPVTIITGYPDGELMARALAFGPLGLMKKPFSVAEIISVCDGLFSNVRDDRPH